MINLNGENYKICYLDTNIIRATLEMSQVIHKNTLTKLADKTIYAISVLTLVEMSHIPSTIEKFIHFMSLIPVLIIKSTNQILAVEKQYYNKVIETVELIMLSSNPFDATTNYTITNFLRSENFYNLCHQIKKTQTRTYERLKVEMENEKEKECTPEEFVRARIEKVIGKNYPFSLDDSNFLAQKLANLLIYYTYKINKKSPQRSDPFDFLIASIVPYMDIFLTENSQANTLRMIKKNHNLINSVEVQTMKELR